MAKVTKEDKIGQSFDRKKIERSVRKAGADEKTARDISRSVKKRDGMSTNDIRNEVYVRLIKKDPKAARKYNNSRRLVARRSSEAKPGTILLSNTSYTNLELNSGEGVDLMCGEKRFPMKAQRGTREKMEWNEVRLSGKDMDKMGVDDGSRILACRIACREQ